MYSPKIDPLLIRPLYHLGKARKQPMTQVVSELLYEALATRDLPEEAVIDFHAARQSYQPQIIATPIKEAA